MNSSSRVTSIVQALVVLSALAASPALAQQPSPDQVNAIRSNCRSDFMAKCSGVTPGGADAIACLRKNVAQLAPACQTAVNAITPKPATPAPSPAAAPPPPAAPPHAPTQAAAPAAPPPAAAATPVATTAAAPPAAAAPAAPAAPARMTVPSADQVAAIKASCPADFATHCAGVPTGGLEGLACLQRNAAQLSAPCRFAVNTTGAAAAPAAMPAATVAAPPPAAPAAAPAAVAAPAPVRTAARPPAPAAAAPVAAPVAATSVASPPTAEQQAAIRAACRSDFMAKCPGVQPGGADALACLKRNAAQLSPVCGTAVSAIGKPAAAAATTAAAAPAAAPTAEQQAAIKRTCQRDFMMNCRGVQPGGPEAFACLQRNSARLSPDCRTSLAAVADPGAAATATATAAKPAAPGLFPIRRAIRERMMGN